jgi:AcrR family transcriptional regulator
MNKVAKPTKSQRTQARILESARDLFAERGYEGATIRDVAARAGIDPAMVIRYFGSKDELFARAAFIDLKLPPLTAVSGDVIGDTLIRHFLDLWEGLGSGVGMAILLRSATSNAVAAEKVREVFARQVGPALAAIANANDAARRAGLISSQLLGLALCRYVLALPPVAGLTREEVIAWIGPTLQRYATGSAGPAT